ncbi:hypothetical protein K488DRAFT_81486 [Vararia minispora EC-137]|uniref:Uncharacterized protein n=1 Tax=Vararia minispora EC-137 TaxID=1314806 RepID=A0ACB8QZK0_9AGAM|nr:hypothetical protein K488DRAFT_81486 [Vararia minispora EC-137]
MADGREVLGQPGRWEEWSGRLRGGSVIRPGTGAGLPTLPRTPPSPIFPPLSPVLPSVPSSPAAPSPDRRSMARLAVALPAVSPSRLPVSVSRTVPTRQLVPPAQPAAARRLAVPSSSPARSPSGDVPKSLSPTDVFGPRPSRTEEQTMAVDCTLRVGRALRHGRDPLDAGQIFPASGAGLGSYYLFYSGVKQALPSLQPPPVPVHALRTEVVDIPGQGKGVLARRPFQTGELVVAERPLLVLPAVDMALSADDGRKVTMRDWCLSSLVRNAMKPSDLRAIRALHNAHSTDPADLAGIFNTNALSIPSLPGHNAPYGALCAHLARINHSCCPNTYWRWDLASFSVHLYAARPIADSEQLSIPYVPLLAPHALRHDQLLDRYIFRCTCPICRGPRLARTTHDARRTALRHFVDTPLAAGPLSPAASAAVLDAIRDARAEQYFFADVWSPVLCYAARAALALGDADAASRFARRAAKTQSVVTGRDGGWAAVARAPQRTAGWRAMPADGADLQRVVDALGIVPV